MATGHTTAPDLDASRLKGVGIWQRYKLGQAQFTSWLKQTAEKLVSAKPTRETVPVVDDAPPKQSRRQKKKGTPVDLFGKDANAENATFVHWSQLEVLAERIVENAQPHEIPPSAINILRDVVALRKKSFNFFSTATKDSKDEKVQQSNANHAHIILVLERVLAKFEALLKAGAEDNSSKDNSPRHANARIDISDLSNMFAYLEVQAPPEAEADVSDPEEPVLAQPSKKTAKPGKKRGGKKQQKQRKPERREDKSLVRQDGQGSWVDEFDFGVVSYEDDSGEDDEFDLYMQIYCFFADFNTIRNYVAERWCDYWYDKSVSLTTLAVITNAAFELFHLLEHALIQDLPRSHPELAEYDTLYSMLFIHFGIDHIDYESYRGLSREEVNERIWRDEADWLASSSYCSLRKTAQWIPPGNVPMIPPKDRKPTKYGANNLEDWQKFQNSVTTQIIVESAFLNALKTIGQEPPKLPTESQLLLDLQDFLNKRYSASPVIFSLHLWVDIRNIIEHDHGLPLQELRTNATKLKQALESHNPIKLCKNHGYRRRWLRYLWETKHYMLEDFTLEDKKDRFKSIGIEEQPDLDFLLSHEPVWTGLLNFRARIVSSQLGHEFVMLTSIVHATLILYRAACATSPAGFPTWRELQQFLNTYKDTSRLKGVLQEQEPLRLLQKFKEYANLRRLADNTLASRIEDLEEFTLDIRTRVIFFQRFADDKGSQFPMYLWQLEEHKHQSGHAPEDGNTTRLTLQDSSRDNEENHSNSNGDSTTLVKHLNGVENEHGNKASKPKRMLSRLSALEQLQMLDETVTSQLEGALTLDYFKLYDDSVELLKAIYAAFPEVHPQIGFGPDSDSPACLDRLPEHLAELGEGVAKRLTDVCKSFFESQAPATVVPPVT
ncbi:hypothetical protein QBC35DRAFT_451929 [Podospora australis]|uniref:DUF6604 domain-containing protein n=1 Tax=Podospora australis TaxID=1536484 RepID=A0AAN6WTC9_9PEZI|nr:hypothetical protein QBC35DRAFT_451929 [Podospora australis]